LADPIIPKIDEPIQSSALIEVKLEGRDGCNADELSLRYASTR